MIATRNAHFDAQVDWSSAIVACKACRCPNDGDASTSSQDLSTSAVGSAEGAVVGAVGSATNLRMDGNNLSAVDLQQMKISLKPHPVSRHAYTCV